MADPTRIRIVILLAKGTMHGQALADKLGVSPPTVTHHMAKLREAGLIVERREKNTIYFTLNDTILKQSSRALLDMVAAKEGATEEMERVDGKNEKLRTSVMNNFFTAEGKLKAIPAQYKKKLIVLEHLVKRLEPGRKYTEKEINEFIKQYHDDFATIRREFIMHQYMYRENGIYELNPPELWTKWEEIR